MDAFFEARELYEQAQSLERAGDYSAALSRLRAAERRLAGAPPSDLADEIALVRARVEAELRAWREEIERRRDASLARERAMDPVPSEVSEVKQKPGLLARIFGRRSRPSERRPAWRGDRDVATA